ncbi:MAG: CoB--CoM heterodisulfide reductase iron-sulfur subunit A family protein [Desulfobacteraceae bacterium]|nr:CoB--CoM heterodisulfide reductase iron-sulfur subunit A family protein [Desulfobacteraceae bacterium]
MTSEKRNGETERVGVYICHCGGNISDHVDVEKVAAHAQRLPGVAVARTNMFMCSDPGQELIQQDIRSGRINRVVIASCAPSLHELTFRGAIKRAGLNPYLYEHANIREQVSWVHHGEPATRKAATLVAAAVAKAKVLEPLEPIRVEARRHATVIGGGVAGLRAALDLARRGIEVVLVEKSPFLGGMAAQLATLSSSGKNAGELIKALAQAVHAETRIGVCPGAEVIACEGSVGNFSLTLEQRAPERRPEWKHQPGDYVPFAGFVPALPDGVQQFTFETGAIVVATGFQPYSPAIGEYGFRRYPEVITLPQLIRSLAEDKARGSRLVIAGKPIRRVAMIHCVGSRQIPGIHEPGEGGTLNEYCSRVCCAAALQAAVAIRESYPETRVFEYYRDIRTYGRGQEELYEQASKKQVLFFRFEPEAPPRIEPGDGPHPLQVTVRDTLTFGEEVTAEVDLVVLAVGMEAGPVQALVEKLRLPVGADRFLQEVHPKLRPVEVATAGIFLAGTCQAPMTVGEACAAAQAAAAKTAALLAGGSVELDPFVAHVDPGRCDGSGACLEACPVKGAIAMLTVENQVEIWWRIERRQARVNPAQCTGCGICVAACPRKAINVNGWTLQQYEGMVDAILEG